MDHINASRISRQMPHHAGHQALPPANPGAAAGVRQPPTLSGYCKLEAGRAITLQALHASLLRITLGRVWLTFNHAVQDPSARAGDHFLSRGESLSLVAGEVVVMESYGLGDAPSAYYSWEPARARCGEAASPVTGLGMTGWMGRAVSRLATAFAIGFVAARARCLSAERTFGARTCGH